MTAADQTHEREKAQQLRRAGAIAAALYHAGAIVSQPGMPLPAARHPVQVRIPLPSVDAVHDAARQVGVEPLDTPLRVTATFTYEPVGAAQTVEIVWMADLPIEPTWDGRDWIRAGRQSAPGREDLEATQVLEVPTYVQGVQHSQNGRTFDIQDTVVFNRDGAA